MKRLYPALILVFISVLAFHCQKEVRTINGGGNQSPVITNPNTSAPLKATLQGNVVDESGQPAIGVTIKVGTKTATTNARGYFRITDAALDKNASLVTADKTGYFKAYRSFSATSGVNQVLIKLVKKTSAGTINSSAGGTATLSNGAIVSLPANGVVKAAGSGAYTGTVNVYASYIDPTNEAIGETVPGSFMAIDKNTKWVNLSSYGMLAVELESSAGEKLQIASGSVATLTIPIPASIQSSAPSTISLWYVDEQTGIWKEEGVATKNGTNYTGQVKHFSYWNADVSVPTVGFTVTIKNAEGTPLTYTSVRVKAATGYVGYAYGVTDSLGQVSGYVPANMNLIMEVLNACNGVTYTQAIGPYSSSIDLGTITISSSSILIVTVKGKIVNCSNAPVTNGHALINYDDIVRYVGVNSSGEFSTSFTTCSNAPVTCEITVADATAQQQSSTTNVTVTTPITDAGTLTACGTATLQYINYNLDGTNYSISTASADSLVAYTMGNNGPGLPLRMTIMGSHTATNYVDMLFDCSPADGIYPVNHMLYVQNYSRIGVIDPFNVTLTNFPQSVGGYYEGGFTGQFRDSANLAPLHNISGTFRIAKNW